MNSDYADCDVNVLTDLRPDLSNICCGAFHGMDPCLWPFPIFNGFMNQYGAFGHSSENGPTQHSAYPLR